MISTPHPTLSPFEAERVESKKRCLNLNPAGCGVGKDKASAETERGAGGFHRVAAGGHVVHEIGLAKRQHLAGAGEVVLFGRDGTKAAFMSGALGLNRLSAADGFGNLTELLRVNS